jgi:hypothetical protein
LKKQSFESHPFGTKQIKSPKNWLMSVLDWMGWWSASKPFCYSKSLKTKYSKSFFSKNLVWHHLEAMKSERSDLAHFLDTSHKIIHK